MKMIVTVFVLCLALVGSLAVAHHPAVDFVDAEIYAMIDDMVADTPHADMEFDMEDDTTTIEIDSVSTAEDLIDDGLLAALSLLDNVTVTIAFEADVVSSESSNNESPLGKTWEEGQDWGGEVTIIVDTLLKVEENE